MKRKVKFTSIYISFLLVGSLISIGGVTIPDSQLPYIWDTRVRSPITDGRREGNITYSDQYGNVSLLGKPSSFYRDANNNTYSYPSSYFQYAYQPIILHQMAVILSPVPFYSDVFQEEIIDITYIVNSVVFNQEGVIVDNQKTEFQSSKGNTTSSLDDYHNITWEVNKTPNFLTYEQVIKEHYFTSKASYYNLKLGNGSEVNRAHFGGLFYETVADYNRTYQEEPYVLTEGINSVFPSNYTWATIPPNIEVQWINPYANALRFTSYMILLPLLLTIIVTITNRFTNLSSKITSYRDRIRE